MLAFGGEEEGAVGGVVHEEVFGEDGGAAGVAEEVEAGFEVGVSVGGVGAEMVAGEVVFGCFVQVVGEGVGLGGAAGGVGAPAAGVRPSGAVSGSVDVDGDKADVVGAEPGAVAVGAAAAFSEGDVGFFWDEEGGVVVEGGEAVNDAGGEAAGQGVFAECSVRGSFSGGVDAVAVVDEDFHSKVFVWFFKCKL